MDFWINLEEKLREGKRVYLLTVIDNAGSSPGRKGFKMIVCEDGFIQGSIGGGVMEHNLVELSRELFSNGEMEIFVKKQIHRGDKSHGSGMICSGEQTVAFHPLSEQDVGLVRRIIDALSNNLQSTLVLTERCLELSNEKLNKQFSIQFSEEFCYKERLGFINTLYIVGGGHVSVAVSDIFVKLGFYVVVLDNRRSLNTMDFNTSAHKKEIVNYEDITHYIHEGPCSYIAIMTHKFVDDKTVLSNLIGGNYAYIGVLGSKAKLEKMWKVLMQEGFSEDTITKVHGPIGLSIKSETPEEIAVSIAAEVIQWKNKKYN